MSLIKINERRKKYLSLVIILIGIFILFSTFYIPKYITVKKPSKYITVEKCWRTEKIYLTSSIMSQFIFGILTILFGSSFFVKNKKQYWSIAILFVFLISIAFYFNLTYPKTEPTMVQTPKGKACAELSKIGFEKTSTKNIIICLDANKDGIIDNKDTLFEFCKYELKIEDDLQCKELACGYTPT